MGKCKWNNAVIMTLFFISVFTMKAQFSQEKDWVNAVGLRYGGTSGISLKHKFAPGHVGELLAGRTNYSYGVTALYQRYISTTAPGLSVFFGGGAHLAKPFRGNYLISDGGYRLGYSDRLNSGNTIIGVDGVIGLEFLFNEVPLSLNAELKPNAEFSRWTNSSRTRIDPGVGLRYHF